MWDIFLAKERQIMEFELLLPSANRFVGVEIKRSIKLHT